MNDTLLGAPELHLDLPATARSFGLAAWVREGLRAGFLLRPRVADREPRARDLVPIAIFTSLVDVVLGRFEIDGPAEFTLRGWLAPSWGIAACLLLVWALFARNPGEGRRASAASWFTLWLVAALPVGLVSQVLGILDVRQSLPDSLAGSSWFAWGSDLLLWLWTMAVVLRLGWHFGLKGGRLALLGAGFLLVFVITAWQFPDRPWEAPGSDDDETPDMQMDPQRFQIQQVQLDSSALPAAHPRRRPASRGAATPL